MTQGIRLFFSYSHQDEALRDELAKHLSLLERDGVLRSWHDRQIVPGSEWAGHIDQHKVSENSFGIPGEEQLVDTPYQFSLTSNEHGRVHGFFVENIFFVVWLDPKHQLYAGNPAGN
jgi:hypothetical protein